jgi:hypothetical protein
MVALVNVVARFLQGQILRAAVQIQVADRWLSGSPFFEPDSLVTQQGKVSSAARNVSSSV